MVTIRGLGCNEPMDTSNLQKDFDRALAIVQDKNTKKSQTPIYRRRGNERQAVKDAAAALTALWKMNSPCFK
jgi:hypothetical protein